MRWNFTKSHFTREAPNFFFYIFYFYILYLHVRNCRSVFVAGTVVGKVKVVRYLPNLSILRRRIITGVNPGERWSSMKIVTREKEKRREAY